MKRIITASLIPGMITAEDVYTYNDQLILPKGHVLTDKTITKLEFYSIINVLIENDHLMERKFRDIETPYSDRVKKSDDYKRFVKRFDMERQSFKITINDLVERNLPVDTTALYEKTIALLDEENSKLSYFDILHNLRSYDDPTYAHSINVGLICHVLAKWLKYSPEDVKTATLCGLFHDVGKLMIPEEILNKPGKLTAAEFTVIKTHTSEGYKLLKDSNLGTHIKNSILMHHERSDGSGYPLGLKADKIDNFAKMVAIADLYDAMTSPRVYRGPMCPFQVVEEFEREGLQKHDPKMILVFLENVVNTYLQNRVKLSNGLEADVIFINHDHLARPTVRSGNQFIDLAEEQNIEIEALI